ncbi:hypothetical protein BGW39_003831, partial [Mortierella sp. 14UC]
GIPLDVKTTMAGLQGLKDIKFLVNADFAPVFTEGYTYITSIVSINNPSRLTLNIGDLWLTAGQEGFTEDVKIGYSVVYNLRLVPGDNIVTSVVGFQSDSPLATTFTEALNVRAVMLNLWANSTATTNPALNAGLASLRSGVLLPKELKTASPPAYSDVWTIKVLPTTVDDGLVEVSTVFSSPYYMDMTVEGTCTPETCGFSPYPPIGRLYDSIGDYMDFLKFPEDIAYSAKNNGSTPLTFKMSLQNDPLATRSRIENVVATSTAKGSIPLEVFWGPKVRLPNLPRIFYPSWSDNVFYPHRLSLKTGTDFPMIMDWVNKHIPPPAVVPPPVVPTTVPSPVVNPSPVVVSPTPVVVSPTPIVAPAA